ncbi:MAG TPA: phenylalanine--tRNA ligase beta subunit-related protein, partial [Longimicrobiales bacterium]|nr:phenylalanine--tRNA ligase beta subunit-related protein [Longimicrobiales bacterium]
MVIQTDAHTLLRARAFATRFPRALGDVAVPAAVGALLSTQATAPMQRDEAVRQAVRDMLRVGGYKPTGRGKPASEYLVRAVEENGLDSINLAVDVCNAVSLHSGFPISVVDADLAVPPYRIAVAPAGERYVFNVAGHEIDLAGLVCLFDVGGPRGNAVKDAQRTKTRPATTATLSVVWGVAGHEARLAQAVDWYRSLLEDAGATTEAVPSS